MNIVVASLLMFADEEEAFYLLCAIVRKVPEYYESNMIGMATNDNLNKIIGELISPLILRCDCRLESLC